MYAPGCIGAALSEVYTGYPGLTPSRSIYMCEENVRNVSPCHVCPDIPVLLPWGDDWVVPVLFASNSIGILTMQVMLSIHCCGSRFNAVCSYT